MATAALERQESTGGRGQVAVRAHVSAAFRGPVDWGIVAGSGAIAVRCHCDMGVGGLGQPFLETRSVLAQVVPQPGAAGIAGRAFSKLQRKRSSLKSHAAPSTDVEN